MKDDLDKKIRRTLVVATEVALVLAILALLVATWMPALVGPQPWHSRIW